ncbi:leukocyte elastase inhibitor-like [Parasteatoda tepidariorum]|uniref:leukocyte elastase inhibitor-like n=1 Tax=Parasteatoda tepidariorum TaxID=114398 RepID=UPI001C724D5A|nr:leukocyte elastase inhibitor-like [Parasteatoda tepidariorum]
MMALLFITALLMSHQLLVMGSSNTGSQTVTFTMRKLAFSTNQFGIDLYRALNVTDENIAFCPFCIGSSLAMVLLGAEGNTAMALRQALYLWGLHPQEIHLAYHDLIGHLGLNLSPLDEVFLGARRSPGDENVLKLINNVYIQRHFSVHYPFQFLLNRYYNTSIYPLDFVMNAEQSTRYINIFFEHNTEGKIAQILSQVPSPSTNLLLLNAIYFKGSLDMNMAQVEESRFVGRAGEDPFIMLEARKARIRYGVHEYLNCTAVEVPFRGGLISLVALLPNHPDGMAMLETRISAQRLTDIINSMNVKRVNFQMPRITIRQTHGNLTKALFNLGLVDLFTPGYANLFGISNFGWLHVTNVTHAAYVEVREGPVAHSSGQSKPDQDVSVVLDRPFLWFVMDNVAGLAIAMGKMVKPGDDMSEPPTRLLG